MQSATNTNIRMTPKPTAAAIPPTTEEYSTAQYKKSTKYIFYTGWYIEMGI